MHLDLSRTGRTGRTVWPALGWVDNNLRAEDASLRDSLSVPSLKWVNDAIQLADWPGQLFTMRVNQMSSWIPSHQFNMRQDEWLWWVIVRVAHLLWLDYTLITHIKPFTCRFLRFGWAPATKMAIRSRHTSVELLVNFSAGTTIEHTSCEWMVSLCHNRSYATTEVQFTFHKPAAVHKMGWMWIIQEGIHEDILFQENHALIWTIALKEMDDWFNAHMRNISNINDVKLVTCLTSQSGLFTHTWPFRVN